MHFSTLALPLMAAFAYAVKPSVQVYSDAACKHLIQTIHLDNDGAFHCYQLQNLNSQAVKFSNSKALSTPTVGFNVWDAQYCAGDVAGDPFHLNQCLSAESYGLAAFKSVHISPRNDGAVGSGARL